MNMKIARSFAQSFRAARFISFRFTTALFAAGALSACGDIPATGVPSAELPQATVATEEGNEFGYLAPTLDSGGVNLRMSLTENFSFGSTTAASLTVATRSVDISRAPGRDGVQGTADDITFNSGFQPRIFGWASPSGTEWRAVGIQFSLINAVAFSHGGPLYGGCLGAQQASPFNNWNGGIRISFVNPDGTAMTVSSVSVLGLTGGGNLRAYAADGTLLGSGRSVVAPGISYAVANGTFWCIYNNITFDPTFNGTPVANAGGPYIAGEGTSVTLSGIGSTDPESDALSYNWDLDNDGQYDDASGATVSNTFADNGSYTVGLTVSDPAGLSSTATAAVEVSNVNPTATLDLSAETISEGTPFTVALENPQDPSATDAAAGFTYVFSCGGEPSPVISDASAICGTVDDGVRLVSASITDKDGGSNLYSGNVAVTNVAPSLSALSFPLSPIAAGSPVTVSASFTDPGAADTHSGQVKWDIGGTFATAGVTVSGNNISATTTLPAGVYTVTLKVVDDDGGEDAQLAPAYVVVYDPTAGFVTGGGWINSPAGAYTPDASLVGRANFGFVSRYQKGATVPTGITEFQFQAGNLNFKSSAYDWLVVASTKALYKGSGTVNGVAGYSFLLSAVDGAIAGGGGTDKFRIKIWNTATSVVLYDNQAGADDDAPAQTVLGGGSIVIHSK